MALFASASSAILSKVKKKVKMKRTLSVGIVALLLSHGVHARNRASAFVPQSSSLGRPSSVKRPTATITMTTSTIVTDTPVHVDPIEQSQVELREAICIQQDDVSKESFQSAITRTALSISAAGKDTLK